jgi:C4-type Zn-finger protein
MPKDLTTCPVCGGNELSLGHFEAHKPGREDEAWQDIFCEECNASWTLIYVFARTAYLARGG